ncbi:MAG: hypothetical protein AAGJ87_05800, partial [Pseudomonadota bacterium]
MTRKIVEKLCASALFAALSSISVASASVVIDGGGDFSSDNAAPTDIGSFSSSFTVAGSVVNALAGTDLDGDGTPVPSDPPADVDVFTFTIEDGFQLAGIQLTGFDSADDLGFIAITSGSSFPFDAVDLSSGPDVSQFDAGALFGDEIDVLAQLATAGIGSGLPDALLGQFTVYIQQLGPAPIDFELTFLVSEVPVPPAAILFGSAIAGFAGLR